MDEVRQSGVRLCLGMLKSWEGPLETVVPDSFRGRWCCSCVNPAGESDCPAEPQNGPGLVWLPCFRVQSSVLMFQKLSFLSVL